MVAAAAISLGAEAVRNGVEMTTEAPQESMNVAFIIAEITWLAVVGILLPMCAATLWKNDKATVRGLNLPRGSVRSILALAIVGSFIIFLAFMPFLKADGDALLQSALTAFGTLSGAVMGFYFGGRSSAPPPQTPRQEHHT